MTPVRRVRVRVEGVVQGVGFRPHVHRLATDLGLVGYVLNDASGVLLEVQSDPRAVERFLERLGAEAPPLARIERMLPTDIAPTDDTGFAILPSAPGGEPSAAVSPDAGDDRVAGAAGGAGDEGVAVPAVGRVAHLGQAVGAGRGVR